MTTAALSPTLVTGRRDDHLSRWLWLVKWLLALPHYLVLAVLWPAFVVVSIVAAVAIVVTGRYPRALFDFNLGVLRWTWRVAYYSYGALGTDEYPPFTLGDAPTYPASLDIAYPEHLSRGLVLVKWWLLALPHYLVIGFFLGGGSWAAGRSGEGTWESSPGLIGVLVLIAGVVLAFTGRYPSGLFDLVLGLNRWVLRVAAYAGLMTDRYPPFRLDMGGTEPASLGSTAAPETPYVPHHGDAAAGPPPPGFGPGARRGGGSGGIVAVVLGALLVVPAVGLTAGGAAALWADQSQRDGQGFLTSDSVTLSTSSYAVVTEPLDLHLDGPDSLYVDDIVGRFRLRATSVSDAPVFVGIARTEDLDRYLAGVDYDVVDEISGSDDVSYRRHAGSDQDIGLPGEQDVWYQSDEGTGQRSLTWEAAEGSWSAVVMNADGTPGLTVRADAAASVPALPWLAAGLLLAGLLVAAGAAVLLVVGIRQDRQGWRTG